MAVQPASFASSNPAPSFTSQPHDALAPPAQKKTTHDRVYQACESCRLHKTKCDRGDIDAPDEVCRRCRREGKKCIIAPERSKKPRNKPGARRDSERTPERDDSDFDNGDVPRVKRSRVDSSRRSATFGDISSLPHLTPSETAGSAEGDAQSAHRRHDAADRVFKKTAPIDPHSSVNTLFELQNAWAAGDPSYQSGRHGSQHTMDAPRLNPARCNERHQARVAWERLSVVREGLFSADEAIGYVRRFYETLHPLTPIPLDKRYRLQQNHDEMITKDPILTITILTIASRYFPPATPNAEPDYGAKVRGYEIHARLWIHLKNLMSRMFWAETLPGNGESGRTGSDGRSRSSSLRSVESCTSLLLLTEWHTRGLHFSANDESNSLIRPSIAKESRRRRDSSPASNGEEQSVRRRVHDWLGPCLRSGHICYSLVANAVSIAIEAGVFDPNLAINASTEDKQYCARLLNLYVLNTAERLAIPPIMPELPPRLKAILGVEFHKSTERKNEGEESHVLWHWAELTRVLCGGNEELFQDAETVHSNLESGEYLRLVDKHDNQWKSVAKKLGACINKVVAEQRMMLELELQYVRIRINSIALSAVFKRVAGSSPSQRAPGPMLTNTVSHAITVADRACITRIIEASLSFLKTVDEFRKKKKLTFLPVRTFFRIVSTATTVMHCFFMGLSQQEAHDAVERLSSVASGLKEQVVDELHVGHDIGNILEELVRVITGKLVKVSQPYGDDGTAEYKPPLTSELMGMGPPSQHVGNGFSHLPGMSPYQNQSGLDFMSSLEPVDFNAFNHSSVPRLQQDQPDSYYLDWAMAPWETTVGGVQDLDRFWSWNGSDGGQPHAHGDYMP